jgi:hypothetical protein
MAHKRTTCEHPNSFLAPYIYFKVPDNKISLLFKVPNNQISLHLGVPYNFSCRPRHGWNDRFNNQLLGTPKWSEVWLLVTSKWCEICFFGTTKWI